MLRLLSAVTIRAERWRLCLRTLSFLMVLVAAAAPVRAQSECPDWIPTFGDMPAVNGVVLELTSFNDGTGPALYVGGSFPVADGIEVNNIARWDGAQWSALGEGVNNVVNAITSFDDGTGLALYVGGRFTTASGIAASRAAKWDGDSWSPVGGGLNGDVRALAVFNDGTGKALYAAGLFSAAGGATVQNVAKWDGDTWSCVGSGIDGIVRTLTVLDDGTGAALYAGGFFFTAGGVEAKNIAKWDGESWEALSGGTSSDVVALCAFDDGTGEALYAGGWFTTAGGVTVNRIARWKSGAWSPLGDGLDGMPAAALALAVFDDGNGPALYVAGRFTIAGGQRAWRIAKWDRSTWSEIGSGLSDGAHALEVYDDGTGLSLYVGGRFTVWPVGDSHLARWGCIEACDADYNDDGFVDAGDIAAFARDLRRDPARTDLNNDRRADGRDLKVFMESWSAGCDGDVGPGRPGSD